VNRVLNTLGLVRTAVLAAAEERLRKADARIAKASEQLEASRAEARDWKTKAGEAERRAGELEKELAAQTARFEKARADAAHHADARARLRDRLRETDRDLAVARDHLMAIEVKLDILEGAANALDARTRRVLAAPSGPERDAGV
jgi:chromosome segregation protein